MDELWGEDEEVFEIGGDGVVDEGELASVAARLGPSSSVHGRSHGSRTETPVERIARLEAEAKEVEEDVERARGSLGDGEGLWKAVGEAAAAVRERATRLHPKATSYSARAEIRQAFEALEEEKERGEEVGRVGGDVLEARVVSLEKQVGEGGVEGLGERVGRLEAKLSLLGELASGSTHMLETVGQRARAVAGELERVRSVQESGSGSGGEDVEVGKALEEIREWEGQAGQLQAIAGRMRALGALHVEAAQFASRLDALEAARDEITATLHAEAKVARELRLAVEHAASDAKHTIEEIDAAISGSTTASPASPSS